MQAREWVLKALELGTRAHAKFPHEPMFATLYSAATGTLPVVDEFLSDVRAFKELVGVEPPESAKVASERETLLQKIGALLRKLER